MAVRIASALDPAGEAVPVNAIVRSVARRYVTTFEGIDAPWSHLAAEVPGLRVHRLFLGGAYLAVGRTKTTPQAQ